MKSLFGAFCGVFWLASAVIGAAPAHAQMPDTILYGVAYYDEYTPVDRVDEDARMMKAAGITVVRIAESTWGTLEPRPGVFDFSHVDRMLAAMHKQGIKVIVGTPTYAIPTWLAREHPNVLVVGANGVRAQYGPRQNMDISDPDYRAAAERVIVALVDHVKDHPAVIGYQLDNETKAYGSSGPNVQAAFVAQMKQKWPSLDALNDAWGLNYWSNRINRWEDFPSTNASINASMSNAFAAFQRGLVTDFLAWQAKIVRAHARPGQFLTQNFDLGWRETSYGIQPEVDHWKAAKPLDIAGIDIYHPSQDKLTGAEIAFGGDLARSIRNGQNYLVIETEAQGWAPWTPYPGRSCRRHHASGRAPQARNRALARVAARTLEPGARRARADVAALPDGQARGWRAEAATFHLKLVVCADELDPAVARAIGGLAWQGLTGAAAFRGQTVGGDPLGRQKAQHSRSAAR